MVVEDTLIVAKDFDRSTYIANFIDIATVVIKPSIRGFDVIVIVEDTLISREDNIFISNNSSYNINLIYNYN